MRRVFTITALVLMGFGSLYQSCAHAPADPDPSNAPWVRGKADNTVADATVAIVQSDKAYASDLSYADIKNLVEKAVDLAGGLGNLIKDGSTVVLKPNLVNKIDYTLPGYQGKPLPPEANGVTTDWRVTRAVVELVRALDPSGKIYVVEGSCGDTADIMNHLRYTSSDIPGVTEFIKLEADSGGQGDKSSSKLVKVSLPDGLYDKEYYLNKIYKEADVLISLPTLKNHYNAVITGGVKNVGIGATPGNIYGTYRGGYVDHKSVGLHRWIHDFFLARPVDFVIMDGLQGIQNGPTPAYDVSKSTNLADDQKDMRLIVAGRDAVAVDTIEALVMSWNPLSVEYLRLLSDDGKGQLDTAHIRVVGKQVDEVRKDFAGSVAIQSYGGAKVTDFTEPHVQVQSAAVAGDSLELSLAVDGDTTKLQVYLDGKPVGPVVTSNFGKLSIPLAAGAAPKAGAIHAYDYFLNRSVATFKLSQQPPAGVPAILFRGDGVTSVGSIAPGARLFMTYDWARLPWCRATSRDGQGKLRRAFEIRAYAWFHPGGELVERSLTGTKEQADPFVTAPDDIGEMMIDVPPASTGVDIYFHNYNLQSSDAGVVPCDAWDSDGGQNFKFTVDGGQPGWGLPTLAFQSGAVEAKGSIAAGGKFVVSYDWSRLPSCRAALADGRSFELRAYARFLPGGQIVERLLAGKKMEWWESVLTMPGELTDFAFDVPARDPPVTSVELWFHNYNLNVGSTAADGAPVADCDEWDSDGGANFSFAVGD